MRILLTNDDGIHSPGLLALARALARSGEVAVVAPERERSATGHAITLHKPLRATPTALPGLDVRAWATNGTPADCVVLGVLALLPWRPDLVISGINGEANIGSDLTYSGTVSGAMEGAIMGFPSLAVSVAVFRRAGEVREVHYDVAADVAARLVARLGQQRLPGEVVLNVNVPNRPRGALRGLAVTRQGQRRYVSRLEERRDPRGRVYYWLTGDRAPEPDEAGTDGWALRQGLVSVTPLRMDMTAGEPVTSHVAQLVAGISLAD